MGGRGVITDGQGRTEHHLAALAHTGDLDLTVGLGRGGVKREPLPGENAEAVGVAGDHRLKKPSHLVNKVGQTVVVDPVAGGLESDGAGVVEMGEAAVGDGVGGPAFLAVDEQGGTGDL